jgi:hypothetical protein
MSNPEMRTILQDLRELIAKEIEYKFMPLHVCKECDNIAEGTLIQQIVAAIRDEDECLFTTDQTIAAL